MYSWFGDLRVTDVFSILCKFKWSDSFFLLANGGSCVFMLSENITLEHKMRSWRRSFIWAQNPARYLIRCNQRWSLSTVCPSTGKLKVIRLWTKNIDFSKHTAYVPSWHVYENCVKICWGLGVHGVNCFFLVVIGVVRIDVLLIDLMRVTSLFTWLGLVSFHALIWGIVVRNDISSVLGTAVGEDRRLLVFWKIYISGRW
jgi:hypothetical protein